MKKTLIFALMTALSLTVLTGCGEDDNGKLSGTYISSEKDKMVLEYKKPTYLVSFVAYDNFSDSLGKSGVYSKPKSLGMIEKNGDFLVKSDNGKEKFFEIKNDGKEIITLYTPTPKTYIKSGN